MRNRLLSTMLALLTLTLFACSDYTETIDEQGRAATATAGEAKAIETFSDFIERLEENPETRTTVSSSKVVSARKTSSSAYGTSTDTRTTTEGLQIWELTIENPNKTQGFAVVTDSSVMDEVIAYSPQGAISDTLHNKGMASYFRDLHTLSEAVNKQHNETRADYWQP